MSTDEGRVGCADFEAMVDELATGVIGEPRRSVLLDHACSCVPCRTLLREAIEVADLMLHFAPAVEPDAGFESRVIAKIAPPSRHAEPRWIPTVVTVAAVVLAAVAVAVMAGRDDPSAPVTAPILTTAGEEMGEAELNAEAAHVVLTIESHEWKGVWVCQLLDGDRWVDVGRWTADDANEGVWATGIDHDLTDTTAMRILTEGGRVIATSEFD